MGGIWKNHIFSTGPPTCRVSAAMVTGAFQTARNCPQQMMGRVQKRVLDKILDSTTTPQTKRFATKVHTQLAHKDAAFTPFVKRFQDIQSSHEISDACLALQRNGLGKSRGWYIFRLHKYYLVHQLSLASLIIFAMNKGFLKSIDLICSQCYLIL